MALQSHVAGNVNAGRDLGDTAFLIGKSNNHTVVSLCGYLFAVLT